MQRLKRHEYTHAPKSHKHTKQHCTKELRTRAYRHRICFQHFTKCFEFPQQLSAAHTQSIVGRDEEDGEKLQAGIQIAIDKGVLEAQPQVLTNWCLLGHWFLFILPWIGWCITTVWQNPVSNNTWKLCMCGFGPIGGANHADTCYGQKRRPSGSGSAEESGPANAGPRRQGNAIFELAN